MNKFANKKSNNFIRISFKNIYLSVCISFISLVDFSTNFKILLTVTLVTTSSILLDKIKVLN